MEASLRMLAAAVSRGVPGDIESCLVDTLRSLTLREINHVSIRLIFMTMLPLVTHENLKLRLKAISVLDHFSSVISSFAPKWIFETLPLIDADLFAHSFIQAASFKFISNSLLSLPRPDRMNYLPVCLGLLNGSDPNSLKDLDLDIFVLLRKDLSVDELEPLFVMTINSSMADVATIFWKQARKGSSPSFTKAPLSPS
jgi:hypothetical protein